ncbi:MAG: GtrA family protein [Oscillospiraceae bacterium]|nr:GtrA family protein [Oscillospiraceae bacterium]
MKKLKRLLVKYKDRIRETALYIASSMLAEAFDWGVYLLMLHVVHAGIKVSYSVGKVSSGVLNFSVNNFIVFRQGGGIGLLRRAGGYVLSVISTLLIGNALMHLFVPVLGMGDALAKLIADLLCFILNYLLQKTVVFNLL